MSLQVWLPLNGDLHNQGLNGNLEFSAINTLTFNNDGKIGKSYQRATNNTQVTTGININSNLLDLLGTEASVAVWVKPLGAHTHYNGTLLSSGNWNAKRWAFGVSQDNTKVDVLCGGYNTYIDCSVPVNQWTHLCSTFDNGISKLYKNGVYIGQLTGRANFDSDATNTCIGRETYASGYFGFNGLINDMRIYDHILSDKEVEEIAKGLILHYKLDDPASIEKTINLCNGATCGTQASSTSPATWGGHKYYTVLEDTTVNDPVPFQKKSVMTIDFNTSYGSGGGASVYPPVSFNIEPSTTYIYSRYIKPSDNFTYTHANFLYRYEYASGGGTRLVEGGVFNKTNTEYLGNGWYRCWGSFTSQATAVTVTLPFYTYPGKSITYELGGIQLEKNTHMTPYVISSNNPMIIDSSGYDNYGIITGDIKTDNNTIKYWCSIKQASGQYIRVEKHPVECMPKDAITVNLWQYATSWYNPISCTEGGGWNFENSNGIRFPVYISGVGYKVAQSSITTASTLNSWHMLTGTMDKDNIKIYYDGQEVGTIANGSTNGIGYANNYIFIGGEAQGNSTSPASSAYVGNLSDVRIYATALTPTQILELYNTSATIDNKGNMYARELVET